MKKLLMYGLMLGLYAVNCFSMEPQDITVQLAESKTVTITKEQLNQLKAISETVKNFMEDFTEGDISELSLQSVDQQSFEQILEIGNIPQEQQKNRLSILNDNQLYTLILSSNYLATEIVLENALKEFAPRALSDAHINRLYTKQGYEKYYGKFNFPQELMKKMVKLNQEHEAMQKLKWRYVKRPTIQHQELSGHESWVKSVAFSPNGRYLASGSMGNTIRIWNMDDLTEALHILTRHEHYVTSVAFSPDGRYLASGSGDTTVRIWNMNNLTEEPQILTRHGGAVTSVAFSPDGRYLASSSRGTTIQISNMNNLTEAPQILRGHESYVTSVAFSPDSRYLASGSRDETIRIWSMDDLAETEVLQISIGHEREVLSVAFSPDGHYLAASSIRRQMTSYGSGDSTVQIWNIDNLPETPQPLISIGYEREVDSVTFSPDSRYLASGSRDETIRIWNIKSLTEAPQILTGHDNWVTSVAFSPDGRYLASGSEDKTIRIWEITEPAFKQAIENLTLPQQQLIVMIMTGKFASLWSRAAQYLLMTKPFRPVTGRVSRSELPEHLRAAFDTLPDVIKQLLVKEVVS